MSFLTKFFAGTVLVCLLSCNVNIQHESKAPFFSVKDVVDEQILVLNKLNPMVDFNVSYNGKTESHSKNNVDWQGILGALANYDLGNAMLAEQFLLKTDEKENGNKQFNYMGIDEHVDIRKYVVEVDSIDRVLNIEIEERTDNFFYQEQRSIYAKFGLYSHTFPILKSYSLTTTKKVRFLEKQDFSLKIAI